MCASTGSVGTEWGLCGGERHYFNSETAGKEAAHTANWVSSQSILTHKRLAVNYYAINCLINEYPAQHLLYHMTAVKLSEKHVISVTEMQLWLFPPKTLVWPPAVEWALGPGHLSTTSRLVPTSKLAFGWPENLQRARRMCPPARCLRFSLSVTLSVTFSSP